MKLKLVEKSKYFLFNITRKRFKYIKIEWIISFTKLGIDRFSAY